MGEESRGKIIGLHNWIQVYLEEKKGNIDYLGWTGKRAPRGRDDVHVCTVKFKWRDDDPGDEVKPCSTFLCGSSPEFDLALLTLFFLAGEQDGPNDLQLGDEHLRVVCYPHKSKYGAKVASAYLEAV